MKIEPLEPRVAPAVVFTFTDVDGDAVAVKISKGNLGDATFDKAALGLLGGEQLRAINLNGNPVFTGANISITAKPQDVTGDGIKEGDGLVNVGDIVATGIDLGTVFVDGDLLALDAGDPANPASACKQLTAQSLGRFPTGLSDLVFNMDGKLDKLVVKSDVTEAFINISDTSGAGNGKIGSVLIGGSLIGGFGNSSGSIYTSHGLGPVTIKGDVVGGNGLTSGAVTSDLAIASVFVGGSIVGGPGITSGVIFSSLGSLGSVNIGGDITGGLGINTGRVFARDAITSVTVGGSLLGAGANSSKIHSFGAIGRVKVGGGIFGGSGEGSGVIEAGSNLGAVTVGDSLSGGFASNSGNILSGARMGSVTIGASVLGGGGFRSGLIQSGGAMGLVKIVGDITAGTSSETGRIYSMDTLAGVTVAGSLDGDSHDNSAGAKSGEIRSDGAMGSVKIGGIVTGGAIPETGRIFAKGPLASVSIGGSLIGGSRGDTGEIFSESAIGAVKIRGDIVGGSTGSAGGGSGYVEGQRIASLFVGGSIRAGLSDKTGSVRALDDIGPITIKGNLVGLPDPDNDPSNGGSTHAIITARGQAGLSETAVKDVAIKSISIGGRVELAQILAGYDTALQPKNADAQIGKVSVGSHWISSNLIVGVVSADATFGNGDDAKISGAGVKDNADALGAISRIGSVVIKGSAIGTASDTDLVIFGIEAQHVVSLKLSGATVPLKAGASNDLHAVRRPLGASLDAGGDFDFHAIEVS